MKNQTSLIVALSCVMSIFLSSCSVKVTFRQDSQEGVATPPFEEFGVIGVQESHVGGYHFTASVGSDIVTPVKVDGYSFQPIWMAQ
jgi:hypothetical protein